METVREREKGIKKETIKGKPKKIEITYMDGVCLCVYTNKHV